MTSNPEVPRFPGKKSPISAFLNTGTTGDTLLYPFGTSGFDQWIESIDVVELTTGGTATSFNLYMAVSGLAGAPKKYFFGNQVSPNTGLYFAYRGLLLLNGDLFFENIAGTWGVYMSGFATPTSTELL